MHDVKIEFVLKSPGEKVYAKAIMVKTMKVIFANVKEGEYMTLYDTDTTEVNPELRGISQETLAERFCIEIGGSDKSIVFFGFTIKTNLSFQTIKKRTIQEFLKTNTYMRLHRGGFAHGVNWSTLGFILEEHPLFTDLSALRSSLMNKIEIAWTNDSEAFDLQKRDDIATAVHSSNKGITFNPLNIPIELNTSTVSARNEAGVTLKVNAVVVSIPQKFYYIGNFLMDHLMLVRQSVTNYIPTGFKKEDPNGHYELIDQHRHWLDQHRNIPILHVPTLAQYENEMTNTNQPSLKTLLLEIPGIERCNYDYSTKRVNVSVNATTLLQVSKAISAMLATADLSFKPSVKQNYNPTGSLGSKKSGTSKYLDTVSKYKKARSPTSSIATSIGNQSHASNRSQKTYATGRTWNNAYRIPSEIDFTEDNFPILPPKSDSPITTTSERNHKPQPMTYREAVAHVSNTSMKTPFPSVGYATQSPFTPVDPSRESPYPNDPTDSLTIQSAISQALATAHETHLNHMHQQQDAHKKEIETLTLAFQAQFKSLQETMTKRNQSPERIQVLEEKLDRTSSKMDERLDKIINLLLLTQTTDQKGPSPFRKKSRQAHYDEEDDDEMQVETFNMMHYHQTVQTVETVEIIDNDHPTVSNTEDRNTHQQENHHTVTRTQQESDQQNQDTDWLRRSGDTQTKSNNTPIATQRNIPNPYRPATSGRHQHRPESSKAPAHLTTLNASRTSIGATLVPLSSTRSDKASLGRED